MPRSSAQVKVVIRELCQRSLQTVTGGDARAVAEQALQLYPEECRALLHASLVDFLTNMARTVFKAFQETPQENGQMLLPGFPKSQALLLPMAVAVPRPQGRSMVYKALLGPHAVNQDDLKAGVAALRKQIGADTARCDALEEFWKYREYRGGDAWEATA